MELTIATAGFVEQFLSSENFERAYEKVAFKKGGAGSDDETLKSFSSRGDKRAKEPAE